MRHSSLYQCKFTRCTTRHKDFARTIFYLSSALFIFGFTTGCSSHSVVANSVIAPTPKIEKQALLTRGMSLSIRDVPPLSEKGELSVHGFLPLSMDSDLTDSNGQISYSTMSVSDKTFKIFRGSQVIQEMKVISSNEITPGEYRIQLSQNDPTWHASDHYFTERGLPVPPEGDANRFLKAALGDKAFFLNSSEAIFCGKDNSSTVSGIQLEADSCESLALQAGDSIIIVE